MSTLIPVSQDFIAEHLALRTGEKKIGESFFVLGEKYKWEDLKNVPGDYVLFGIPEDIGPRANSGRPGSSGMWLEFLPRFLNIQENEFLSGSCIVLGGHLDCSDLLLSAANLNVANENDLNKLRDLVGVLDGRVFEIARHIFSAGKIPLVIGGGHNNCYGLIKAASTVKGGPVSVLNIDPHADLRPMEKRHSGNGFSYARHEGFLKKYFLFGMHESYNSEYILQQFREDDKLSYLSYDAILRNEFAVPERLNEVLQFLAKDSCGFEIDLDAIAGFPSSAQSNSGFTVDQIRSYILFFASRLNLCYAHFPEGAPVYGGNDKGIHGKTLAYLVSDFIKSHQRSPKTDNLC